MGALRKALKDKTITHLTGANNYTWFHYQDGTSELFSKTIQYFDGQLPSFIRIHKSILVNPSFIKAIRMPAIKKMNGSLTLKAGLVLPISRRRVVVLEAHPYWQAIPSKSSFFS